MHNSSSGRLTLWWLVVIAQYSDTRYLLNTGAVAILMSTEQISIVTGTHMVRSYQWISQRECWPSY